MLALKREVAKWHVSGTTIYFHQRVILEAFYCLLGSPPRQNTSKEPLAQVPNTPLKLGEIVKGAVKGRIDQTVLDHKRRYLFLITSSLHETFRKVGSTQTTYGCNLLITTVSCCNDKVVKAIYDTVSQTEFGLGFVCFDLSKDLIKIVEYQL